MLFGQGHYFAHLELHSSFNMSYILLTGHPYPTFLFLVLPTFKIPLMPIGVLAPHVCACSTRSTVLQWNFLPQLVDAIDLMLVRAECVRQRNEVAIKLGIISLSSIFRAFCSEETWSLIG